MKRIFFTYILITATICSYAQTVHTGDFVIIPLPKGTQKLTKQQTDALPANINNVFISKTDLTAPYNYKLDNIIINIFRVGQNEVSNDLISKKAARDEGYSFLKRRGNNSYHSMIKSVDNKKILIINFIYKQRGSYKIYIQNIKGTLTLPLYLDYPEADSVKAAALLDDILNNAQFTR